ncbi:MAG: hypothetical protein AAGA54_13520 [Myxococcota bacterium]
MFWTRKRKAKPQDRKRWLYDAVAAVCEREGFVRIPALNQFRRENASGFECIIVSLGVLPASTLFELHVGLRNESVEELAFQYTNGSPMFRRDSMTLVASAAKLQGLEHQRFEITELPDVEAAMTTMQPFLADVAFPWLCAHRTVEAISRALNEQPLEKTRLMPNQVHRCFRGLAAARVAENTDYDALEQAYDGFVRSLHAPEHQLALFEELKQHLRAVVWN